MQLNVQDIFYKPDSELQGNRGVLERVFLRGVGDRSGEVHQVVPENRGVHALLQHHRTRLLTLLRAQEDRQVQALTLQGEVSAVQAGEEHSGVHEFLTVHKQTVLKSRQHSEHLPHEAGHQAAHITIGEVELIEQTGSQYCIRQQHVT